MEQNRMDIPLSEVGSWVSRTGNASSFTDLDKASGRMKYSSDLLLPGMLIGRPLWSDYPHARLNHIDIDPALRLPGVHAVITARDIPGENAVGKTIRDQPYLVSDHIRSRMDVLALVVAETEEIAEAALKKIVVDITPLPPVFDIEMALSPNAPKIHPNGNNLLNFRIIHGDAGAGMSKADVIVKDTYYFPWIEQAFIEPETAVAAPDEKEIITIWLGCHDIYSERRGLARAFDWPENRFRVILVPAGGSFGGKDDNVLSVWAALAAYKTDHPVIFSFSRPESMRGHSKRHSMRINHTLGASKDGLLISAKVSIWSDTGAYAHWGENIIRFASLHSIGPYRIPNAFVEANLVYTNNIAAGAMRGWGTPQVSFAAESQMDRLAERLDMHPLKLRWLNALRDGDTMITGALPRGCRFMDTLESAANRIGLDLVSIKQ